MQASFRALISAGCAAKARSADDAWSLGRLGFGFGVQNKLAVAERQHASYCAKYISTRLAQLAPPRRAYGFSASFPRSKFEADRWARS